MVHSVDSQTGNLLQALRKVGLSEIRVFRIYDIFWGKNEKQFLTNSKNILKWRKNRFVSFERPHRVKPKWFSFDNRTDDSARAESRGCRELSDVQRGVCHGQMKGLRISSCHCRIKTICHCGINWTLEMWFKTDTQPLILMHQTPLWIIIIDWHVPDVRSNATSSHTSRLQFLYPASVRAFNPRFSFLSPYAASHSLYVVTYVECYSNLIMCHTRS